MECPEEMWLDLPSSSWMSCRAKEEGTVRATTAPRRSLRDRHLGRGETQAYQAEVLRFWELPREGCQPRRMLPGMLLGTCSASCPWHRAIEMGCAISFRSGYRASSLSKGRYPGESRLFLRVRLEADRLYYLLRKQLWMNTIRIYRRDLDAAFDSERLKKR